jgi:hypothetical protein
VEALKYAQKATELENDFLPAYNLQIALLIKEKKYEETVLLMEKMAKNMDVDFSDTENIAEYADFIQSTPYLEWKKKQNDMK